MKSKKARREMLASKFVQAFDDNDTEAALALMAKQPIWEFAVGPAPAGAKYEGIVAVRNAINDTFRSNPGISYKTIRAYSCDDSIIHEIHVQCAAKKLDVHAIDIFTFNDTNEIVSKRTYRKIVTDR